MHSHIHAFIHTCFPCTFIISLKRLSVISDNKKHVRECTFAALDLCRGAVHLDNIVGDIFLTHLLCLLNCSLFYSVTAFDIHAMLHVALYSYQSLISTCHRSSFLALFLLSITEFDDFALYCLASTLALKEEIEGRTRQVRGNLGRLLCAGAAPG